MEYIKNNELEYFNYSEFKNIIPFDYVILNAQGLIIEANEEISNIFGITKQYLLKQPLARYIPPDYQVRYKQFFQNLLGNNNFINDNINFVRRGDSIFKAKLNARSLFDSRTQKNYAIIFIQRDDSETHHLLPNNTASIDKVLSIENLTSVMMQELNQPFSIIYNYLYGSIQRLESGKYEINEVLETLKLVADQSNRCSEIVLKTKNFLCKGILNFIQIQLNDLIKETLLLLEHEIANYSISVQFNPVKNLPLLALDKIHIQQALIHIIRNSIDSLHDAKISNPKIYIEINLVKKNMLEIYISDNGPGLSPYVFNQLFNPYFTTKPYGTGLGLAFCYHIIKAHGGELSVETNALGNPSFKILLISHGQSEDK